jgi:hypothetical protein
MGASQYLLKIPAADLSQRLTSNSHFVHTNMQQQQGIFQKTGYVKYASEKIKLINNQQLIKK